MSFMSEDNFSMSADKYLAKHKISVYLEDSITQLLEHREDNPKVNPAKFLCEYFCSLRDGNHTMFREFNFIKSTPHNRASFIVLFWKCFRQIGKKGDLLSIHEYHSLMGLLCADFPFQLIQKTARQNKQRHYKAGRLISNLCVTDKAYNERLCLYLADLRDLHLYLQHLGILDLTTRCSVSQFVGWREVFPYRFCHEVSEINNSFGYSEPIARWCFLIVGVGHGLFCCLLETVGSKAFKKSSLSPDVFYVDQAKACLLRIQSPNLIAALDFRVSKESQRVFTKSDYCATYVNNTTGGKNTPLFSTAGRQMKGSLGKFAAALGSEWPPNVDDATPMKGSTASFDIYKSSHSGKMYPVQSDSFDSVSFNLSLSDRIPVHRLSLSNHPRLYQYCCLDGLEGTIYLGQDGHSSGIFHHHLLHSFYKGCRQIQQTFSENESKKKSDQFEEDEASVHDSLSPTSNFRGMKEIGILMNLTPHQDKGMDKNDSSLEYWIVGRKFKQPHRKIFVICFHALAPENVVELAFKHSYGVLQ